MNMISNELRDNLKFQFDISRQLLEYHLSSLQQREYTWRPSINGLHIHNKEGTWYADWPETEDYEMGAASIAWTMWHIIYWWEMVFDYSFGNGTLQRQDIRCDSDVETAKEKIKSLTDRWEKTFTELSDEDLLATKYTKWPFTDLPFHKLCSWLNLELMKNASEIGYCRFHYASTQQ
ncbi:hypothetical protein BTR23_25095 [Alkalihalophilus pseudofirmus]|nr:hypothetical protein BTR23_25095 [Alkalihalophilus pseudofirmus]